jgi:CHAD domain-containing protein
MHKRLLELTDGVARAGENVLSEYVPKQLYAFRVGVRRVRSILKQIDSHRSRRYRKIWGGFAAVTNDARDWDVFLITAKNLLSPENYREFEELNREQVRCSREAVIEMFHSMHWQRHLDEWTGVLERADEQVGGSGSDLASLELAQDRARLSLERALAADDDHCWHKFRIRVKDVRYVAEAGIADPETGNHVSGVIESCKKMQTLLGDWHDTVVQLNMLEELQSSAVHSRLRELVSERRKMFLEQIRQDLAEHPLFTSKIPASPGYSGPKL